MPKSYTELYIVLASGYSDDPEAKREVTKAHRALIKSQRMVQDLPNMLKKANVHVILSDGKYTDENEAIKAFNQKAHCLQDNAAKIALLQSYYATLVRRPSASCLKEGFGNYIGGKFCAIPPNCPLPKGYWREQKWVDWQDVFFGMGACGDGVMDYHPVPFIYEYKKED